MNTLDDAPSRAEQLAQLEAQVRVCTRCDLHSTRIRAVPGEGPLETRLMFIGEGPGFHEDRSGRPFVGAAGQLLEELLASIGLARNDVYITNVVKCRPPDNRNPEPHEIESCKPYLRHQIRIIDPDVIVTLGRFAMERWLPDKKISKVHGQGFRYGRRLIVPLLHPAAALRSGQMMAELRADFLRLPDLIEDAHALRDVATNSPTGADTDANDASQQPRLL